MLCGKLFPRATCDAAVAGVPLARAHQQIYHPIIATDGGNLDSLKAMDVSRPTIVVHCTDYSQLYLVASAAPPAGRPAQEARRSARLLCINSASIRTVNSSLG